jgi:choline dehydrogenase-like flavoprotein
MAAARLARKGIRSIVLESGNATCGTEPDPLNEVVQAGQLHRGALSGRFRGLGGTSLRWGGAMLPFLPCDLEEHTAGWPVAWPLRIGQLESHFREIETIFGLPQGLFEVHDDPPGGLNPSFVLRSAKLPPFSRRNVATTLRQRLASPNADIWLNATVTDFRLNDAGRVAGVTAMSPSGARLDVESATIIVAAGAIESTRLLLLLDARNNHRIFAPDGQLGRYFFDHLAGPAANIFAAPGSGLNETFGLRFVRSGMRDLRMEADVKLRRDLKLPGAFAQVRALSDDCNAFAALRAICLDLQSRSQIRSEHVRQLGRDFKWIARAGYWRFIKGRLLAPRNSLFELTLVIEQWPSASNTISLAADRQDAYGVPLARLSWQVNPQDCQTFNKFQSLVTSYWTSRFTALGILEPTPPHVSHEQLRRSPDFFHPGGTTRMSSHALNGVVDANLRTHRIPNLYVVSTSSFPSGGGSNPTFMLMAFALRAAEHVQSSM